MDFLNPDRIVIGDDRDWAGDAVAELYAPFDAPLVRTDIASAEMIKLAANAFLATKISFINEIANVCEETGADVVEVARGMGLDARIGPKFLQAGLGYGGSCFTKDVSALKLLAGNSGYHFQLLNAVIEVNELQKRRVVSKLQRNLGELAGRRVALLGLAFKPNTDDMRGASSLVLAARLRAEGVHVRAFDPIAEAEARLLMPQLDYASDALDAVTDADAVVLVTEWPEFLELDWSEVAGAMRGQARDRRPQRTRSRRRAGRRAHLRGHRTRRASQRRSGCPAPPASRACRGPDAGRDPRRRRGHAPATADLDRAQAGRAAGRPSVHLLHARVAAHARGRRRDHVVRLPRRRACATCSATAPPTACGCASSRSPTRAARPAR